MITRYWHVGAGALLKQSLLPYLHHIYRAVRLDGCADRMEIRGFCLVWVFIEDWAKLQVYRHLELGAKRHLKFLGRVQEPLHSYTT